MLSSCQGTAQDGPLWEKFRGGQGRLELQEQRNLSFNILLPSDYSQDTISVSGDNVMLFMNDIFNPGNVVLH